MSKYTPEKNILPAGQNSVVSLTGATAAVSLMVIQKAIAAYSANLSERTDLDSKARIERFDEFIAALVCEAKNAPVERVKEIEEATAKATVCSLVATISQHPRRLLSS